MHMQIELLLHLNLAFIITTKEKFCFVFSVANNNPIWLL